MASPDLHELISEARRLEALSMAIYVRLAKTFAATKELHEFWMSMARHEAGHIGALELIEAMAKESSVELKVAHTPETLTAAGHTIERLYDQAKEGVDVDQAFSLAVELESTEIEDLVLDLIHGLADRAQRDQAQQMVLHDLSDLSLMIEKYSQDEELLARADALVERHVRSGDSRRPAGTAR